ncbi:MAG: type IV pilus biogenesis/stability protein PilW [Variovorax sp.]
MSGCATQPAPSTKSTAGNGSDLVTSSDEGDARKRARMRLDLAIGYFQQGQTTVALDEVKKSLATDPQYSEAYNLRGLIYMRLDDAGLAEDSFRRAVAINPGDGDALHNYGWLLCQRQRYADADSRFDQALAAPNYTESGKTLMTKGLCELKAGQRAEAERTLQKAYEIDAGNAIVGYNLALLMFQRDEAQRARFYIKRVNESAVANAESLWLGIKIERQLKDNEALARLASRLQGRFPQSAEALAYGRGNFNE